jgi:uncharacterized protein (TIGR03083 family)
MGGTVDALAAERQALLELCKGFSEQDWAAPSGCEGWSTQDVLSHLGAVYWMVVDPAALPDTSSYGTEGAQEFLVQARRSKSTEEVVADYEAVSAKALEALVGLEGADFEIPLGDLGTYPANLLPTAFCFDHFTHIRADLFAPRGSLTGARPPVDEMRVAPVLDWIEAALPQQNAELVASIAGPVDLVVTGPGGRTLRVGPAGVAAATVTSDALGFVQWITNRAEPAAVGATTTGDDALLGKVGQLRVF